MLCFFLAKKPPIHKNVTTYAILQLINFHSPFLVIQHLSKLKKQVLHKIKLEKLAVKGTGTNLKMLLVLQRNMNSMLV